MRLEHPRISPLAYEDMDEEQRALVDPTRNDGELMNVMATLARHPKLLKRWRPLFGHVLFKSSLSARDRELAILRTAARCHSDYEWGQHVPIGREAGLDEAEIARIPAGAAGGGWSAHEAALLDAVDELLDDSFIRDATWTRLAERYGEEQFADLIFCVGQYKLVAMALNSFGVQFDDTLPQTHHRLPGRKGDA